jgi:cysteine desulfurase
LTFTSGATEALHTVICGVVNAHDHVVVSAVEHPATWGALRRAQADVSVVPVDRLGRVDPAQVQAALKPDTKLVIQMAAQNELGVVYPTQEIASVIDGVPLLVDAAQAYGKVPLDLSETGATYAVVSGHKMGAPLGVGALWCRDGEPFTPYLEGGAQERGRRAGTENVPAIVGFGVAADEVEERLHRLSQRLSSSGSGAYLTNTDQVRRVGYGEHIVSSLTRSVFVCLNMTVISSCNS